MARSRKKRNPRPKGTPSDTRTGSGLPVDVVVGPREGGYLDRLGFPGQVPFTRGVYPTMYRGRLWTMRQYAGFGTAEESNRRYRFLLSQGNTGLSVAFDLPTQMGYDSDHAMAAGEVGKVGVAVSSVEDMRVLFGGIPLADVSTSMTINATAIVLLAMYTSVAEDAGAAREILRGTVQNDILKEYIARSTYIYPPEASMRLTIDIVEFCVREMPRWNPVSVSGYHIREAGSTAVQEVAFTLADAVAYVEAAVARGLKVDSFAPRLSFFFNAQSDLLEEIAKFRAARRLWARIMTERFRAKSPESKMLRFHAQTAGASLTAQQPEINVVRTAYQALAAALGGAQSLHTNSMDEALGLPSEKAVRIALRTQQVLAHETGIANTADPVGGAYFVEAMADAIEEEAAKVLDRIERMGGMLVAIERGWVQREIAESAYRYQLEVEDGARTVVGVNRYATAGSPPVRPQTLDPRLERARRAALRSFRSQRDDRIVRRALDALRDSAASKRNLVRPVLTAVRARATLGEISDAMRETFGVYRPTEEV